MTTLNYTVKFKKTVLASIVGLSLSQSCFALEALSDDSLSDTTGEGIALLPQDAYMVFRGAGANETAANVLADRSKDTGYIHMIPVGPLTPEATAKGAGKADLYVYGLALSKSDDDANSRLATTAAKAAIASWGTASNPWILKVATQNNVPNFAQDVGATKNTESGNVSYLALEAPLYEIGTRDAEGADAYKLKLAMWADAFQRDPNKAEFTAGSAGQNPLDAGLIARMRLQMIWNNFSINGSKIQLFQTLDGAKGQTGLSPFYDKTLGLSGVLRFNSGDAANLKLNAPTDTVTKNEIGTLSGWQTINSGANQGVSTAATGNCGNGGGAISGADGCKYIVQKQTRTDSKEVTRVWSLPDAYKNNVLRLSTRETAEYSDPTKNLYTPAVNGGGAPAFDANEGIFIYNLNTNLVLGNLYQPLIVGSDGRNFTLELARIPNKEAIYKQIYTDYGYNGTVNPEYKGSTCNVYKCGDTLTLGGKSYQGSNATHSSISIGSVTSLDGGKTLEAYKGADAVGISFGGQMQATASNTVVGTELRYAQRNLDTKNWVYEYQCTLFGGCGATKNGTLTQWAYVGSGGGTTIPSITSTPSNATCSPSWGSCGPVTSGSNQNLYGTAANTTWSATNLNGAAWQTMKNTAVDNLVKGQGQTGVSIGAGNLVPTPTLPSAPSNNFGSAVIDGMLIQHLKITTKGL